MEPKLHYHKIVHTIIELFHQMPYIKGVADSIFGSFFAVRHWVRQYRMTTSHYFNNNYPVCQRRGLFLQIKVLIHRHDDAVDIQVLRYIPHSLGLFLFFPQAFPCHSLTSDKTSRTY